MFMAKQAVSVTLDRENLLWLRARAGALKRRSLSDALDALVTAARQGGGAASPARSVVGTVASWFENIWRDAVRGVQVIIQTLQGVFSSVFNAIMSPIRAVIGLFDSIVGAIQNVISWLGKIKIPDVLGAIGGLFGASASVALAPSTASVFAATGVSAAVPSAAAYGASGAGGTVINVYGGLDSGDTIARRIRSVLDARDRRENGVRIVRKAR